MSTWPPTVDDVKTDAAITVSADDARLAQVLNAAIAYVTRVRPRFNYEADPLSCDPAPTDDLWLGTVRLAGRWHTRRRAAAGQIYFGETGASDSVPFVDPDIERLLGIGRFAKGAFA
jgi:transposase